MSGTKIGGMKAAKTNKEEHGEDFYRRIGRIGGRHSKNGGFASDKVGYDGLTGRQRAAIAGAKAGRISKRGFKYLGIEGEYKKYLDKNTGKAVKYPV